MHFHFLVVPFSGMFFFYFPCFLHGQKSYRLIGSLLRKLFPQWAPLCFVLLFFPLRRNFLRDCFRSLFCSFFGLPVSLAASLSFSADLLLPVCRRAFVSPSLKGLAQRSLIFPEKAFRSNSFSPNFRFCLFNCCSRFSVPIWVCFRVSAFGCYPVPFFVLFSERFPQIIRDLLIGISGNLFF